MPNAIITGASSGLGRALARALADRGYSLTIDARHADPLEVARRSMAATGLGRVTAVAGDVDRPGPPGGAGPPPRRARPDRPAGQQRQRTRRQPAAGAARPRLRRRRAAVADQRRRAAAADPAGLPHLRRGRGDHQRLLRRGGRALRGLGRLRRDQGRARPPDPDLGGRGAATSPGTPSIPATCARRCTRPPSPARTSPTGPSPRPSSRACSPCSPPDGRADATGRRSSTRPSRRRAAGAVPA